MSDPGAGLVVRDVTVRQVVVPLRRPLATRVGDFPRWPLLLIDIRTEQGITGRGYLGPYLDTAAAGVRAMAAELGEALRGHPAAPAAAYRAARLVQPGRLSGAGAGRGGRAGHRAVGRAGPGGRAAAGPAARRHRHQSHDHEGRTTAEAGQAPG
jgi:L-alanine-DL-glutamate epimerase-like enolase superfamily enzyme